MTKVVSIVDEQLALNQKLQSGPECCPRGSCEIAPFLKVYMLDDHKFMDLPRSAVHFGSSDFFLAQDRAIFWLKYCA